MTLRRIAEITGRPVPALSAASLSSSSRLPDRSPGRTQLSVRSTSAKPASASWPNTPSHTLASASLTLRPKASTPGNCSRAPDMGHVWAVYWGAATTIFTPMCKSCFLYDLRTRDVCQLGSTHGSCRAAKQCRLGTCLLYTSDAADDLTRVDLGGRRIIKK